MELLRTEGIILHSLPLKDWDLLLTIFTSDFGLTKLYFKNGQSKNRCKGALTTPLTQAEFLFFKRRSELFSLKEISVINLNLELRTDLIRLEYSCAWLKLLLQSQLPGKSSPLLYKLLKAYLSALPEYSNPAALHGSFYLKLLRFEGLIELSGHCALCQQFMHTGRCQGNQTYCRTHAQPGSLYFTEDESHQLLQLAYCQTLKEIKSLQISQPFIEKLIHLYHNVSSI